MPTIALDRSLSLIQLILLGFALVALPMAVVLVTALVSVDRLSSLGQQAASEAYHRIQAGRTLVEQVTAMERDARQYTVLGDADIFDAYATRRQSALEALEKLRPSLEDSREQIDRLLEADRDIFESVRDEPADSQAMSVALDGFPELSLLAYSLLQDSARGIGEEIKAVGTEAVTVRGRLLWLALALPPVVVGLTILFAGLIARPLRRLEAAIRGLGAGELDTAIVVDGPHDLADLGRRLDWLRERLVELEDQKISFLRHVSHELKTPLTNIREGTNLLSGQLTGTLNAEQHEIAQIVQTNCEQLQQLIEDLIRFSVARTAMPTPQSAPVALNELIGTLAEQHKPSMLARGVTLQLRLGSEDVRLDTDKVRVIIDNLLSNAIRFAPADTSVTISTGRQGRQVFVEVQDEGPGIAAHERERVFELFYQGQSQRRLQAPGVHRPPDNDPSAQKGARGPGSGLGLAIAREYARAIGGRLRVADNDGSGARLRLELPSIGSPPLAAANQRRPGRPAS